MHQSPRIAGGDYTGDSEAIRDFMGREQARSIGIGDIRQALIEGEQSGQPAPFDFTAFKPRKTGGRG